MGWRERDWAKWTDEERARFLGSSGAMHPAGGRRAGGVAPGGSGFNRRLSKGEIVVALLVALAVAGYLAHRELQRHQSQPSASSIRVQAAPPPSHMPAIQHDPLQLPPSLRAGTYVTTSGTLGTNVGGPVIVEARWRKGPWLRLATANVANGAFRVRYLLSNRGRVHIRIALPDGNYLVGSSDVT